MALHSLLPEKHSDDPSAPQQLVLITNAYRKYNPIYRAIYRKVELTEEAYALKLQGLGPYYTKPWQKWKAGIVWAKALQLNA